MPIIVYSMAIIDFFIKTIQKEINDENSFSILTRGIYLFI